MHIELLDKSKEKQWDHFVLTHPLATIHQTSAWGHLQEKIPARGKYFIVVLKDREKIIGGSLVVVHKTGKDRSFLYCPRGPLLDYKSANIKEYMKKIADTLSPIAKKENAIFLRIDPPVLRTDKSSYLCEQGCGGCRPELACVTEHTQSCCRPELVSGPQMSKAVLPSFPHFRSFFSSPYGFQPTDTLILDITKPEKEILAQMKEKGRYNIRLAEKKGVVIREVDIKNEAQFKKDVASFHQILHETTMRDKFYGHRKEIYSQMLKILCHPARLTDGSGSTSQTPQTSPFAKLYLAEYQNTPIAGIICTFYADTATYYYGASSNAHRNLMAPYLLQWHAILEAKSRGFAKYDFLGIAPKNAKNHTYKGITEFKEKFGGTPVSYHYCREYTFSPFLYLLYRIYKYVRK
jgi:lipid II:glycine glycyltransferase (peptidoglycan interpeptide bridge formation enzyme)